MMMKIARNGFNYLKMAYGKNNVERTTLILLTDVRHTDTSLRKTIRL